MKISFCMIAFNEAPTIRANLVHLYPHAHEIIVCEGSIALLREALGVPARSDDGTVDALRAFPDPSRKLRIIQRDWRDKNEMAAAYAEVASGDIIWHVDADEFYDEHSFLAVPEEFDDPALTTLDVPMYVFWKTPSFVLADERDDDRWFRYARVLRRQPGMSVMHIPVRRIVDGRVDEAGRRGPRNSAICGWHYAWNDDARVRMKMEIYGRRDHKTTRQDWLEAIWDRWLPDSSREDWPDGVHPSTQWRLWPVPYRSAHPPAVAGILKDLDCLQPARSGV